MIPLLCFGELTHVLKKRKGEETSFFLMPAVDMWAAKAVCLIGPSGPCKLSGPVSSTDLVGRARLYRLGLAHLLASKRQDSFCEANKRVHLVPGK